MFRTFLIVVATVTLAFGGNLARADHDDAWRYVLGGALIGAAVGSLAADGHHHGYVDGHVHVRAYHPHPLGPRYHVHSVVPRGPVYVERYAPRYRVGRHFVRRDHRWNGRAPRPHRH